MAVSAFQDFRNLEKLLIYTAPVPDGLELRLRIEGLFYRHLRLIGNELTDLVTLIVRNVQGPGTVLDDGLCLQGSEGTDLAHPVLAVVLGNILDYLTSSFEAEVDIEIRHRYAFGVEEPLEEEVVLDRVDIRDRDGVGDQGAGSGTTSRSYRDVVHLRPVDVVADDEEVALEVHSQYDVQLVIQSFLQGRGDLAVSFLTPFIGEPYQVLLRVLESFRDLVLGKKRAGELDVDVHPFSQLHRILQCLRAPGEELCHFRFRLEVELIVGEAHALLILLLRARSDT